MSAARVDFESVALTALSQAHSLLSQWFPAGKFVGHEFVIGDLSGTPGESLSVNTVTGAWADFSTDDRGGDLISLYAAMNRLKQIEAARQLSDILGGSVEAQPRTARVTSIGTPESPEWDGIFPIPDTAPAPPERHPHHGRPVHVARYRDREGHLLALVYRCEPDGQRKQVVPLTYCRNTRNGRTEWRWQSLPKPRSLYRVELIGQLPGARILLVEGEPKCDAANRVLPEDWVVLTWPNGAKSWKHVDWRLLKGCDVTIWPDADAAGRDAARQIADQLPHYGAKVRLLEPPSTVSDGWDIGDAIREGWDQERLLAFIDPPKAAAEACQAEAELPVIRVISGELHETATQAETALLQSGLPLFQRGRMLVLPVRSEVPASRGRTTLSAGLAVLPLAAMVDRLCRAARWERFDGRLRSWVRINAPTNVGATVLSRVGEWRFPQVAGVITTPTLRPDGSLLTAPGHDRATRLYHAMDEALNVQKYLSARPTRDDALRALDDLCYLISKFPTTNEVDHAVALSGLITPVIRGAISVAPMHAFRAQTAGTGKTYLVDVAAAIATARPCPVATVAKTEEETEKRIGGMLLAAFPLICLDNVNGELGGDLLCQAIERPIVQIRPLGTSEIIEVESRASIYATGNSLRVRGDMTRRSLICNLDAQMERPELRVFDFDPVETVLADRARYVAACLTIVMAHAQAGFPGECTPLASFGDWSRYVRAALIWLGKADPCISMEAAREDDPELGDLRELVEAWKTDFGTDIAPTTAEIVSMVGEKFHADEEGNGEGPRFPLMLALVKRVGSSRGALDSLRIGQFLRNKEGRIVNGYRIRKAGKGGGHAVRWQLAG